MLTDTHHNGPDGRRPEVIISVRGVTKRFGSHTVLENITFDVPKGRISAIMGPSGTGKSVLLKNIIGLLRPEAGEIWVDGEETVRMGERDLYRVRRKFGVLFQDGALFGSMTSSTTSPSRCASTPRKPRRRSARSPSTRPASWACSTT